GGVCPVVHGAVPDPGAVPDGLFGGADGGPGTGGTKAGAEIPDPAGRAAVPCQRLVSGHPLRGVFWGPAGHLHRLGGGAGGYGGILCGSGLGVVSGAAAAPPDLARGPACLCRQRGGGAGRQRRRDECAAGRFDCPGRRRRHGGLYHDRNGLPAAALHVSVHLSGVYVRRGHAAGCGPAERNAAGRLRSGERADGPGHGGMLHPA
ncbi:Rebeccamycin O-methyltransferase, partial [Dysosmobacter welbionis]